MATQTQPAQSRTAEEKIQEVRAAFADAPELGKKALENALSEITALVKAPRTRMESAGRVGSRQGTVSEFTLIFPFAPGGAKRLRTFLTTYSTYHEQSGLWVLCGDHGRHFNHSDEPNTLSMGVAFGDDIAAAHLPAGTELTTDYNLICDAIRTRGAPYLGKGNGGSRVSALS